MVVIFYGVSMLIAAIRGYAGCRSLAISNWLLKARRSVGLPLLFTDRLCRMQGIPSA
jgi:hypothetical protein